MQRSRDCSSDFASESIRTTKQSIGGLLEHPANVISLETLLPEATCVECIKLRMKVHLLESEILHLSGRRSHFETVVLDILKTISSDVEGLKYLSSKRIPGCVSRNEFQFAARKDIFDGDPIRSDVHSALRLAEAADHASGRVFVDPSGLTLEKLLSDVCIETYPIDLETLHS